MKPDSRYTSKGAKGNALKNLKKDENSAAAEGTESGDQVLFLTEPASMLPSEVPAPP